jgi:hypothetical protein
MFYTDLLVLDIDLIDLKNYNVDNFNYDLDYDDLYSWNYSYYDDISAREYLS